MQQLLSIVMIAPARTKTIVLFTLFVTIVAVLRMAMFQQPINAWLPSLLLGPLASADDEVPPYNC